jgi:aspartate aminotransferase
MGVSELANAIVESPTLRLNEVARQLRERGEAVINLGVGEPTNRTPESAVRAASDVLDQGTVKYGPAAGSPTLRKAIVKYTEANYNKIVTPANVIVSPGAKQVIFNLLFTLVNPGDQVVILAPYWVSYPEMIKMVRGVPVVVNPPEGSFHPRLADIERAVTPATKAIIVNSPNNPSGAIYPEAFIAEIVEFCERRGIYLLMDDIYHKLVFDGKRAAPAYEFTTKDLEDSRIITINGIAKLYGMTGFRIGWCVVPKPIAKILTNIQAQTISCISPVMQAAAEGALTGLQDGVEELRRSMEHSRDIVMRDLASFPGVKTNKPEGTFYVLPDFRAYNSNSVELAQFLLDRARVVTVPGREFGMEGHLRFSYSGKIEDVSEAIVRMKWALDPSSPKDIHIGGKLVTRDW